MIYDRVPYEDEELGLLELNVDGRGRLFVREEARNLLFLYPKCKVVVEKTKSGQVKLKIQKRGEVVKVWLLTDALLSYDR